MILQVATIHLLRWHIYLILAVLFIYTVVVIIFFITYTNVVELASAVIRDHYVCCPVHIVLIE